MGTEATAGAGVTANDDGAVLTSTGGAGAQVWVSFTSKWMGGSGGMGPPHDNHHRYSQVSGHITAAPA